MATFIDVRRIGKGGFGEVWRCKREADGEPFAKKKLLPNADEDSIRRFAREVRIQSKLDHPNIVKVIGQRL